MTSEPAGTNRKISLTLELQNAAQTTFPDYVLGPARAFGYEPGTYVGILSVNVPAAALQPTFQNGETPVASGRDGISQVVAVPVEIPAGERHFYELTFEVPSDSSTIQIEPSARVPGIAWNVFGASWIDAGTAVVDLSTETVRGEVLERSIEPVVFEPDPINNPVAPIPIIRVDGDVETTVVVSWQSLRSDPGIDVWEREAGADWVLVAADVTTTRLTLPDRERRAEYCYRTALHGAPERFSAGECLEVRGPNGSGKSTLLRCVAGLFTDYAGTIQADQCLYLGHKLGLNLLLTARQNLLWYQGLRGSSGPISEVLGRVGMAGYERVSCQNMSAGQQRRIGLARMLIAQSPLWLLDEPLTALDANGHELIASLIEEHLRQHGAVLCATHQSLEVPGVRTLQLGA